MLALGSHSKDRKSTRDKANIGNPKVNKGCPPTHSQPHLSRLCGKFTWTLSTIYSTGVYHTGVFNAMNKMLRYTVLFRLPALLKKGDICLHHIHSINVVVVTFLASRSRLSCYVIDHCVAIILPEISTKPNTVSNKPELRWDIVSDAAPWSIWSGVIYDNYNALREQSCRPVSICTL